jgi:maleate isomerase
MTKNKNQSMVKLAGTRVKFEGPRAWKRLGLIALATDLTSERDFARLLPHHQAGLYTTRVAFENPATPENLRHMAPRLTTAADLILPGEPLDAICYSCTAASVIIGEDAVTKAIQDSRPGVPVITPSGAALQAFSAMGINRIAILTPYLVETSLPMVDYFSQHGLEVTQLDCFGLDDDRIMARVSHDSIIEAACKLNTPEVEAIFISCTGLPAVPVIAKIEALTGKPVVTSNQASAWAMMLHSGLDHRPQGYGRLFDFGLTAEN